MRNHRRWNLLLFLLLLIAANAALLYYNLSTTYDISAEIAIVAYSTVNVGTSLLLGLKLPFSSLPLAVGRLSYPPLKAYAGIQLAAERAEAGDAVRGGAMEMLARGGGNEGGGDEEEIGNEENEGA